jgi:hypothetical protein
MKNTKVKQYKTIINVSNNDNNFDNKVRSQTALRNKLRD